MVLPGERAWSTPWWLAILAVAMILVAVALAVAGALRLGTGLTASPLPSPAAQLRTTGPYACVRHPIYAALLFGGAGLVILGGRPARVAVWLALLALLWAKTVLEERKLSERFADYRAYAANARCVAWETLMHTLQQRVPEARPGEWWADMELVFDLEQA